MSDFKKLPCTTACDGPQPAVLVDCEGVTLVDGDAVARCSDIPDPAVYSLVEVTPDVEGHPIATINVDGTDFVIEETVTSVTDTVAGNLIAKYVDENGVATDINETVTQVTELDFTASTSTLSLTYRNETGVEVTKDVNIPVKVAVEHISPIIIDPASTYLTYSNQIVVDANGNFYGFNAAGVPTKLNISETVTTMTGVQATGKTIGTYTNEQLAPVEIKETVTTMTGVLTSGTKIGTYTNENGNPVDLYVPTAAAQVITTLAASFNEATSVLTLTYVNENNTQVPINVTIASVSVDTSITQRGLVNLTSLQHLGAGDKLINGVRIGRGGDGATTRSTTNTFISNGSGYNLTTGTEITATGAGCLQDITTGTGHTFNGFRAGYKVQGGVQSVGIGTYSLANCITPMRLIGIGHYTLANVTTGTLDLAIGWQAGFLNTSGSNNVYIGDQSGRNNEIGNFNLGIGAGTLTNNKASGNVAIAQASLFNNTFGINNTSLGSFAMFFNTIGSFNLSFGNNSMRANISGNSNTMGGTNALLKNVSGSFNTGWGEGVLREALAASNNSGFGRNALSQLVAFDNCTGVGANSQVTGSNQVQLGDAATTTYVYGTVQNRSDERDKADIADTELGLDFINALRPRDYRLDMRDDYRPAAPVEPVAPEEPSEDATAYELAAYGVNLSNYKQQVIDHEPAVQAWVNSCKLENIVRDGSKKRNRKHHGFITQEVKQAIDSLGVDFGGYQDHAIGGGEDAQSLGYDEFIAPLVKSIQELSSMLTAQAQTIAALEARLLAHNI
jgi:hypothetical protein